MPQIWCFGVFTWNLSPCGTTDALTARLASFHITGPSQCPRVDKPQPASIAGARSAVAGRPWKVVAQVVWNCPLISCWYTRQFSGGLHFVSEKSRFFEIFSNFFGKSEIISDFPEKFEKIRNIFGFFENWFPKSVGDISVTS